jgi:hypothetical protein
MKARCWIAVTLAVLVPISAGAQSASAQAEILFHQGRDLMKAGKYAEACTAFETSQKLDPKVTTLLNLADCRERNGQLATALASFSEAEKAARAGGAKTQSFVKTAANHAANLEGRLSKLTIAVAADRRITGLELTRNAEPVDPATWGIALPVDGGTYEIVARAPGRETWSTTVRVKVEGDAKTVDVPALAPKPTPPAKSTQPTPIETPPHQQAVRSPPADAPDEERMASRSHALPITLAAASVVLAGGALGFELWARSTYSDAQISVDPSQQLDLWHSANTKRYVADGMLGAGVVTAGIAVWLWVRDRGASKPARMAISPVVSTRAVGFELGGAW